MSKINEDDFKGKSKGKAGGQPKKKSSTAPKRKPAPASGRKSEDAESKGKKFSKGPKREFSDRKTNEYPKRKTSDNSERASNERPERRYENRPKPKPKPQAKVQSSLPHQGKPKAKDKDKAEAKAKDIPKFHPRNPHQERYDLKLLTAACPELAPFVTLNLHKEDSIDFHNLEAVKLLNKALLKQYYGIDHWDIPTGYQIPAVPLRADYIHHIASLLGAQTQIPQGAHIRCLDIGVGASCIYPIIGNEAYGWSFVGSEIDPVALESAKNIVESNGLQETIELRLQGDPKNMFAGVVTPEDRFDLCMCNPPYHLGAALGAAEKTEAPKSKKNAQLSPLTGVLSNELSYEGGEEAFLQLMVRQSQQFRTSVYLFSSVVLKQSHLKSAYKTLQKIGVADLKVIQMGQGNKSSRILAWTFMNKVQQEAWRAERWKAE